MQEPQTNAVHAGGVRYLEIIKNVVLIAAGLAALYYFLCPTRDAKAPAPVEVGPISYIEPDVAQRAPVQAPDPAVNNVPTQQIADKLSERAERIKADGPVVLKSVVAAQQAQAKGDSTDQQAGQQKAMKMGVRTDGTEMTAEEKKGQIRYFLNALPESYNIKWVAPEEKVKIWVFTDPTCPYCRKLHDAIPELNAAGITVSYFMYPRDLPSSTSTSLSTTTQQLNNVWCAKDQVAAFNDAFKGFRIPDNECGDLPEELGRHPSPVMDHYFIGSLFEVQGTPTILTSNGDKFQGFKTADALIRQALQ